MSDNLYDVSGLDQGGGDDWKSDDMAYGKPVFKPTPYLRRKPPVKELVEQGTGYLTDQGMNHEVRIDWKLNKAAIRDKVFKLTIDEKVVYLDLEEVLYYTRIMFVK